MLHPISSELKQASSLCSIAERASASSEKRCIFTVFKFATSVNLQISFAAFVSFSTFLLLEKRKAQKAEKLIGLLKYLKTF